MLKLTISLLFFSFTALLNAEIINYTYPYYPYGYNYAFLSRQIDEEITWNIQNSLEASSISGSSPIKITVTNQIVTLSGSLNTEEEKQALFSTVSRVPGLKRIIDRVLVRSLPLKHSQQVSPSLLSSNKEIEEEIITLLNQRESPDFINVKIYVNDRYVVLTGSVKSVELKREATKRIRTIPNIVGIENRILIDIPSSQ